MVILPGIRVIVRGFLCIVRGFLRHLSKKFYVHVLAQCALDSRVVLKNSMRRDGWHIIVLDGVHSNIKGGSYRRQGGNLSLGPPFSIEWHQRCV